MFIFREWVSVELILTTTSLAFVDRGFYGMSLRLTDDHFIRDSLEDHFRVRLRFWRWPERYFARVACVIKSHEPQAEMHIGFCIPFRGCARFDWRRRVVSRSCSVFAKRRTQNYVDMRRRVRIQISGLMTL